jgi:hypothetical protein
MVRKEGGMLTDLSKSIHFYLFNRSNESTAKKLKTDAGNDLRAHIMEFGREDESGHKYLDLDPPLTIDGVTYTAIKLERRVASSIDLDATEVLMTSKGRTEYERVFKLVTVEEFDENEFYLANQRGVVSDDELDAVITEEVTYALVPVKS